MLKSISLEKVGSFILETYCSPKTLTLTGKTTVINWMKWFFDKPFREKLPL